jgi:FAD/FMN-containing dehydrogenase
MFDAIYTPGLQHYWKADFVPSVTDEAIKVHAEFGPKVPSLWSTMHLYPQSGQIQQVARDATAYSHRDVEFVHNIVAIDADPAKMPADMQWMNAYRDALLPTVLPGGYVNFMMDGEGQERVRATYRDNYARLAQVKQAYDPDNVFHVNQNIKPAI